jgi:isocitrate dehydrogenase
MGVDVFLHNIDSTPDELGARLKAIELENLKLTIISNRGMKVFPKGFAETFCSDHWRCRFLNPAGTPVSHADILRLLANVDGAGLDFIKIENLCTFDGELGWSADQGA